MHRLPRIQHASRLVCLVGIIALTLTLPARSQDEPKAADPKTDPKAANAASELPKNLEDGEAGKKGSAEDTSEENSSERPTSNPGEPEPIQLSFKGVEVDFLIDWLANLTGKTIVKHKDVKCLLTIMSPRKLPQKEALELVYRSLSLEGFSVVEKGNVIMIVPEAIARQITPARVFQLKHADATRLQLQIKGIVSEKAKIQIDVRSNRIIVTDTTEKLKLVEDIIRQLDVSTEKETATKVIPLVHAKAEDLTTILQSVFSGKAAPKVPQQKGKPAPPVRPLIKGAKFTADRVLNRLIVTAPPDKMPEIEELIATLDTDKPQDVMPRVIQIKHVEAKDLVGELSPMFSRLRGQSLQDAIDVTSNSRSNCLIVLSSKKNFEAIEELVKSLDTADAQQSAMRSFPLKNADAEEVAEHLTELFEQTNNRNRYSYYNYYSRRSSQDRGKLRFVADRRRSAVVVIGSPGAMEGIEEMIKALDEEVDSSTLLPRIYQLKFVSAFDIEELLSELFTKKNRQRSYYDWEYGNNDDSRDIGKLYGKLRVTSEFYTNSLIVTSNSDENFKAIEDIIKQLDVPSESGDTTVTLRLNHAKAVTVANNLNVIFAQGGAPPRGRGSRNPQRNQNNQNQPRGRIGIDRSFELQEEIYEESYFPWLSGGNQDPRSRSGRASRPVSDLVGKVRIVPDHRTNTLLISSNAHLLPEILKVVEELDVPTPQVLIEAKIIEVGRDLRDRMGVRWSPDGAAVFETEDLDNSLIGSVGVDYTEVFAGTILENAMRTGVLSASANLDLLIQFLRKDIDAKMRAEPRINVEDNERGKLFVGSRVPFISGSLTTTEGGRNDTFEYIDVGIILEVTPHINDDGDVTLGVRVESSQIRAGETLFGGAIIDTRNYRTNLTVKSGETLVLGGIIQTEESDVVRKVPLLGDIPLLGWFFKKQDTVSREIELMVFLRPTVTRTPEEVRRLMEEEKRRTTSIQAWQAQLKALDAEEERLRREEEKARAKSRE